MIRTLRKRYLLRFKGADIFAHVVAVSVMFALMSTLVSYRLFGIGFTRTAAVFLLVAIALALVTYLPLRVSYRVLQRQPLVAAVPAALAIVGFTAYAVTLSVLTQFPSLLPGIPSWPKDSADRKALEVAVMTVVVYTVVIQIAVSTRRERMARRMNMNNRLKALQARMRPHFFFNTLNSVASLIRSDPDLAEKAIEDLADLFRVVIRADRKLVSLAEEVEIARQYINIEKLRLGERLTTEWHISDDALGARVPILTLQPLLENAVYHGIEPRINGGTITVDCSCEDERLLMLVTNPVPQFKSERERGNRVALSNIKERLKRQFGGDVRINIRNTSERFNVSIDAPLMQLRGTE